MKESTHAHTKTCINEDTNRYINKYIKIPLPLAPLLDHSDDENDEVSVRSNPECSDMTTMMLMTIPEMTIVIIEMLISMRW